MKSSLQVSLFTGLVVVLAGLVPLQAQAQPKPDLPPLPPEFEAMINLIPSGGKVTIKRRDEVPPGMQEVFTKGPAVNLRTTDGVQEIEDGPHVGSVARAASRVRPASEMAPRTVKLAVPGPAFAGYKLLGMVAEGPGAPSTRSTRVFRHEDGSLLRLSEWDFKADDGGILLIEEYLNVEVHGARGYLLVTHDGRDKGVWSLMWPSGGIRYELDMEDARHSTTAKGKLLRLAKDLRP